jgi:hypothetical protein
VARCSCAWGRRQPDEAPVAAPVRGGTRVQVAAVAVLQPGAAGLAAEQFLRQAVVTAHAAHRCAAGVLLTARMR